MGDSDTSVGRGLLQQDIAFLGVKLSHRQRLVLGGVSLAALVALPYLGLSTYYLALLTTMTLFICLAGGFNIIAGFTGQLSLGHAAFFGLGGYAAILMWKTGYTLYASLGAAFVIGILTAIPIGLVMLRLRGLYFAFGTLAVSEATLIIFSGLGAVGGSSGLNVTSSVGVGETGFYYLSLGILVLLAVTTYMLKHSIFGLRLRAIRDDEAKAEAQGVNTWLYKNVAFVLSAIFPALAGGVYALYFAHIDPTIFGANQNINMQLMAVLGGLGTLLGPIVGGALFYLTFQYTGILFPDAQLLVTGVALIMTILFIPKGIIGTLFKRSWPSQVNQAQTESENDSPTEQSHRGDS